MKIQGKQLAGFNKDFQPFCFCRFTTAPWPNAGEGCCAVHGDTFGRLAFRRLFRALRDRRNEEAALLHVTWLNIAFTRSGIEKLTSPEMAGSVYQRLVQDRHAGRRKFISRSCRPAKESDGLGRRRIGQTGRCAADRRQRQTRMNSSRRFSRVKDQIEKIQGGSLNSDNLGLKLIYTQKARRLKRPACRGTSILGSKTASLSRQSAGVYRMVRRIF